MASKLKEDKLKLVNLVSASLFAEPRFNQASDEKAGWIRTMVYLVADKDPEFILKVALYVRDDLNVRSTANYMLALAANTPACAPYLKKYYHKAVRLPSDWLDVAALYQMLPDRSLSGRALPKCLRTAMMKKFQQFDAYQLGKYNKENSMKRKRRKAKLLAEKCREEGKPEPRIPERQLTIKQMIRQLHISQPVPHVMCIIGKKYPSDLIGFRDCGLSGNFDLEKANTRMKLPVPETWETVISARGNKAEAWEELIDNRKLPFMAMLRNLRNLLLTGISHSHHRWVMSRLRDENTVANSRQFPFSFFTAYEALEIDLDQLAIDVAQAKQEKKDRREGKAAKPSASKGENGKRKQKVIIPKVMPTKDLIEKYRAALDTAVKIATVHNVKPIRGSTVVFCSASQSMREGAISARNVGRAKTNVEVGALLGLMCKYMCEECDFRLVASPKRVGEPDSISIPLKDGTILDNMSTVQATVGRLGDGFNFPFKFIEDLINERKKIDNLIILSDQTIAPGYTELVGRDAAAEGISGILRKYRQEINPDLLYVSVNLAGRKSIVTDTIDESKKHPNDVLISGFSDAILRFVAEKGDGNQLEYIQNIDVVKDLDRLTAKLDNRFNKRKIESQTSTFWSFMDKVQTCKHNGCGQKVKQDLLEKHMKDCDFRVVPCPEEGCMENVPASLLELHRSACLFRDTAKGEAKKWRTVRVFVSSTFRDMHGERDVLSRFVFPEIKEFCKKRRIHFFDVDLRWGVTESHTLETGSAIDTCLNEVDRCRPFFIGLLGGRYGWAPEVYKVSEDPRFTWVKSYPPGRSITELEMEYGALAAGGQQLGTSFFVRQDNFSSKVPSAHRADFEAPEEDLEKLGALRAKLLATGRATTYPASWGGIVDDKPMAGGLDQFRDAALRSLKEDIIALFPEDDDETALGPLEYETQVHEEYLEVRSRRFIGRKEQLKEMFAFADDYKKSGRSGPLVVHGTQGMGKTSTLAKFCRDYREARPGALVLSHFVGSAPGSTDIRHTLHRLCSVLVKEYALDGDVEVPQTYDELKLIFPRILELCAFGRPLVVCIDSLNALSDNHRAYSLEWLPHAAQLAVPIIVSTYTDSKSFDAIKPRVPAPPMVVLLGLPEEERKQLVRVALYEYRKVLEEKASNNQMRTLLRKSDSSKPLWLTIACEELRMFGVYELLAAKLKSLPAKVPALLDTVLARLEGDHDKNIVASALSLVCCTRNGLSEAELLQLMAPPGKALLPRGNWAAIQRGLESLLRFVGVGEEATLDFAHEEMSAAVQKRYLRSQSKLKEAHSLLATFFLSRADPSGNGSFLECTDQRAIRELPYHLLEAGRADELEDILCNVEFIRCKCSSGMVHELLEDVNAFRRQKSSQSTLSFAASDGEKEEDKIEDLFSFLNASSHVLSVEPRLCLQEAANQPDSSFLARAVKENGSGMMNEKWLQWLNKPQVQDACQFTLSGFSEAMMACAFSPDGKKMVCASRDRSLATYDTSTGAELATFLGHTHWVVACSYSPTGGQIVSASWDNTLRIWDADLGTELTLLAGRFGHKKRVAACAYSADGSLVISGAWDCSVKLWDAGSGECLKTLKGHIKPVNAVAFSEDAERAASASWDCSIKIWDVYSGKCTATLTGHSQSIRSVTFAPNGRHLISTAADCSIRIWDIEKSRAVQTIKGHTSPVNSCSLSSDGKHLISASDDQTVKVWDALGGSEIRSMALPEGDYSTAVAMSPNGRTLVSGSSNCDVHVWDTRSGKLSGTLKGHTRVITSVAISSDSRWAVSGAEDKTARVWNLQTMELVAVLSEHEGAVHGVAFDPRSKHTLATASEDFTARLWKVTSEAGAVVEHVYTGHGAAVLSCAFAPTGDALVTSSRDGTVRVWSRTSGGESKKMLRGHKDWITGCAFSPDSKRLATVSWDFNVKVWDAVTFEELHTLAGHGGGVTGCAWAPSSKMLVTSSFDGTLRLWDTVDGVPVNVMEGHLSRVNGCSWHEGGTKIASASDDGTVKLWDSVAGTEIATLQGHSGTVQSVDFSHDKSHIVSASTDKTVKVWRASVSRVEGATMSFGPSSSHKQAVTAVCFSAGGETAISAARDAEVLLWDVDSCRIDPIFDGSRAMAVTSAALASDEAFVCSGGKDGWLAVHDRTTGKVCDQKMVTGSTVVSSIAYAPGGREVTTGSWGHSVQIWKISREGKLSLQCTGMHDDWVNDCVYSTCSSFVMTASHDRTVRLWKTTAASKLSTTMRFTRHKNWVLGCDFVPNSTHRCASVSYDGVIKLWDAALGEEVRHMDGHADRINACRFLTENLLVTASHDHTVRVWDVRVPSGASRRPDVAMFHCKAPVTALGVAQGSSRFAVGDSLGNVYFHELHY